MSFLFIFSFSHIRFLALLLLANIFDRHNFFFSFLSVVAKSQEPSVSRRELFMKFDLC
jgi:hypothetical protein